MVCRASLPDAVCETCRRPFRPRASHPNRFCSVACTSAARVGKRWVPPQADGCWLHPSCVTCPYPVCALTERPPAYHLGGYLRRLRAAAITRAGGDHRDVQRDLGISPRHAYRLVAEVQGRRGLEDG